MSEVEKPDHYLVEILYKNKHETYLKCISDSLIDNKIRVFCTIDNCRVEIPLINVNQITFFPDREHFIERPKP